MLENTDLKFGKPYRIRDSKTLPLPGYHLGRTTTIQNPNTTRKYMKGKKKSVLRIRVHRMTVYGSAHESTAKTNTQYLEEDERTTVKCVILQTPAEHAQHGQIR